MLCFTLFFLLCITVFSHYSLSFLLCVTVTTALFFKRRFPWLKKTTPYALLFLLAHFLLFINTSSSPKSSIAKVVGRIVSIPNITEDKAHFSFLISKLNGKSVSPFHTQLTWHHPPAPLQAGQTWKLQVHLQKIHSKNNPGSFNYARWAQAHHIAAQGFVLSAAEYELVNTRVARYALMHLREHIGKTISNMTHSPYTPFLTALSVGLREGITPAQWHILQATGTNHLIAIAGLHIGFLTGFVMAFTHFIWRRHAKLPMLLPAPLAAALAALLSAFFYSALAGFSLPTCRALIMLSVLLLSVLTRQPLSLKTAFSLALMFMLIINPLVVYEDSFWLSFGSVALILYSTQSRLHTQKGLKNSLKLQWMLTLGLTPFTILFFQQISGVSFISNAIAIPCIGWLILPLCLTGVIFLKITPLSQTLFYVANKIFSYLWWFLEKMASMDLWQFHLAIPDLPALLCTFIGTFIVLSPAGLPGKYMGLIWYLPLFINYHALHPHEMKISILDISQGQSIVVQTPHHALLFDAGDKQNEASDASTETILPFLNIEKIDHLDSLIISSDDKNSYGGTQSLVNALPVQQILTTTPSLFKNGPIQACKAGQEWTWDAFQFDMLYPTSTTDAHPACVLLITTPQKNHLLITGPLTAEGFQHLSTLLLPEAFTLITPHVGATTKSLQRFVKTAAIEQLILSGPPFHPTFSPLFSVFDTARSGMLTLKIKGQDLTVTAYKEH